MIGRSHSKGVFLCYHYEKALTTDKMVQTIETAMSEAFGKSNGWLRSSEFQKRWKMLVHLYLKYHVCRSPNLNPIEKFFALVTKTLRKQVIEENIVRETYDEFVTRA